MLISLQINIKMVLTKNYIFMVRLERKFLIMELA